ncbi:MAG TPA: bifunctional enoyl-CoA hydratase/phosphate acetyltransferase [Candidatus Hydrothermia bacterium]|nr:bifunctional enoyl-CoA hydratase/phosphate acetyltransferase [Candidatus Hydrothermae bacterium]MDD3649576.1 bifunctional enoyl-CoA hydratase/phosphate acetyltransferase [Candidatus Hydrothermia bacterium]MDD5572768.1 bifunctional enoyl-CoA hydratase/phosphate acetyltransferase [Candidatus Hydrothermia bacterium]HOK23488.1 bifunctional enoyl-CoA hydratase/phosphate acetyltransferase [Candidatus Hydrothermia bacterium]HOL24030.1 bifunctional enoyl-CoA hydratase/phosphate acetyltransferase [Ca
MITSLDQLVDIVKGLPSMRLVVACGEDPHTIEAVSRAKNEGLVDVIMVGNKEKIASVASEHGVDPEIFKVIDEPDNKKALKRAVKLVRDGEGDILMKGLVITADYMRAILDKESGLVPPEGLLSHVTLVEIPTYPKLLIVSDVAVIILPDLNQKVKMLQYTIDVAYALEIKSPYAFLVSAAETISSKLPSAYDAAIIKVMAERGQIKGAKVEGPVGLDLAILKEAAKIKGFKQEGAGEADILIFPNIEAANIFYKTCTILAKGRIAGIVVGATAPCVLTSRADSEDSKFHSIALAALMAGKKEAKI